jgi:peptidoglycan/LPS O-acetylase OafA/YrhL
MPIFTGVLFAEVSMTPAATYFSSSRSFLVRLLPYFSLILGWYFISYPNRHPNRMPWSHRMLFFGRTFFPGNSDIHAYYNHIGASLIIIAVVFSTTMQRSLNVRVLQWLGARSFPIYLVHGPVLRSFMNWVLFIGAKVTWVEELDDEGKVLGLMPMFEIPPVTKLMWAIPLFLAVTLFLANLWFKHVEPLCGRIAKQIEEVVCGAPEQPTLTEKFEVPEFKLMETNLGSPLSRATTPMNEVELVLPR